MRKPLSDQHKIAGPTKQPVVADINPVPRQLPCNGLKLSAAHKIEVSLVGEELETKSSHSLARLLLRQPMHERQLGVELDWKPPVRGRQEEPLSGDPAALAYKATLVVVAAYVLKHGGGMHKIV